MKAGTMWVGTVKPYPQGETLSSESPRDEGRHGVGTGLLRELAHTEWCMLALSGHNKRTTCNRRLHRLIESRLAYIKSSTPSTCYRWRCSGVVTAGLDDRRLTDAELVDDMQILANRMVRPSHIITTIALNRYWCFSSPQPHQHVAGECSVVMRAPRGGE